MRRRACRMIAAGAVAAFGALSGPPSTASPPAATVSLSGVAWHVEHDETSRATVVREGGAVILRFDLAPGRPTNQFAAAVAAWPGGPGDYHRLVVRADADRPMRIAIQLRGRDDAGAPRWRRTMYVDGETRTMTFDLDDFRPVAPEMAPVAPLSSMAAVMLGVDTVNTRPATRATLAVRGISLVR